MADGVRIRLTEQAQRQAGLTQLGQFDAAGTSHRVGLIWIIRDIARPRPLYECGYCTRREQILNGWKAEPVFHDSTVYHQELEHDYSCIVSVPRWRRFQELHDNGGFELVNDVAEPPTQTMVLPTAKADIRPAKM